MSTLRPARARRVARVLTALLAFGVLAGCGVRNDSGPRDITGDRQEQLSDIGRDDAEVPAGGSRIYLLDANSQVPVLRTVARDVEQQPGALVAALLAGPSTSERTARLRTAIPTETELLGVRYDGPTLVTIDLSAGILNATGDTLVHAVAQIVYTISDLTTISAVQLTVDGQARQWPIGDGTLTGAPLSIYLYPGLAATTQPDYPALPTPTVAPAT